MCTLLLHHLPGAAFPLLIAANRDEMLARPCLPPAAHWPQTPTLIGGLDTLAGGTWLAINSHGVVAGILNSPGTLGPAAGKASRGHLPLTALAHPTAESAAIALHGENGAEYRGFNLVIADRHSAWFLTQGAHAQIEAQKLPPGFTMVTALAPNNPASPRVARQLPKFQAAPLPIPPDWASWPDLLSDNAAPWESAISLDQRSGFGTASASLIALTAAGRAQFLYSGTQPHGKMSFSAIDLPKTLAI